MGSIKLIKKVKIYHTYDGHCGYCGKLMDWNELTRDHIVPYSKGATLKDNMMPSCARCNSLKSDLSLEEFRNFVVNINGVLVRKSGFIKINKPVQFYFESFSGINHSEEAHEASIIRMLAEKSMKRMYKVAQKLGEK